MFERTSTIFRLCRYYISTVRSSFDIRTTSAIITVAIPFSVSFSLSIIFNFMLVIYKKLLCRQRTFLSSFFFFFVHNAGRFMNRQDRVNNNGKKNCSLCSKICRTLVYVLPIGMYTQFELESMGY